MAIPILWRILLGYSVLLVASVGLSLYSIVQLGTLSDAVTTTLNVDNRMIDSQEKLTDAILSEVRYGNKFVITHANLLLDQFREFKKDSTDYLGELNTLAHSGTTKARLARVQEYHLRYHDLFDRETSFVTARQTYAESRYREEKEKIVERILAELQGLKEELQKNVHRKLQSIEKAARLTRTITILTTLLFLGIGVALSVAISKGMTQPISEIRQVTAAEAEANLERTFDFFQIPEIQEDKTEASRRS